MGVRVAVLWFFVLLVLLGCSTEESSKLKTLEEELVQPEAEKQEQAPLENVATESQKSVPIEKGSEMKEDQKDSAPKEEQKREYTLEMLQKDINEITGNSYEFKKDPSREDFIRSNALKYYVIHTLSPKEERIGTSQKFCEKYCAENWNDWSYYGNSTLYRSLIPVLGKENFTNEYEYNQYRSELTWVEEKIVEKVHTVENGKVLEYQYILWTKDSFDYFEGAYADTLLIFKVYCSPDMVVFLRPKWDDLQIGWANTKIKDALKSWDETLAPLRKELLAQSNELLARCGVDKEFFESSDLQDFSQEKTLAVHWRPYYKYYLNLTGDVMLSAVKDGTRYELEQINVTLVNNDYFDLGEEMNLKITLFPDGQKQGIDYFDNKVASGLRPGEKITRSINKEDTPFKKNITVGVVLYTVDQKGEIRPFSKTFAFDPLT